MPTLRASLGSLVIVATVVVAATIAALIAGILGSTPPVVPGVAAFVVAVAFAWRPPVGLLAFGIFALVAATLEHWLALDLLLFDEIGLVLLVIAAVIAGRADLGRLRLGWLEGCVAVLALAGVVSSVANEVPAVVWTSGLLLLMKGIVFFYLVRLLPLTLHEAGRMGVVLIVVGGTVGVMGLVEWLDPDAFQSALALPDFAQQRGDVTVVRAIFLHPALYGWLTAFTCLLLFARFITHRSWWALPPAIVLGAGTLLSGRRTPLLGVAAALAVGAAWATTRVGLRRAVLGIWVPAVVAIVVAGMILAPWITLTVAQTRFEYGRSLEAVPELFAEEPRTEIIGAMHPRIALYAGSAVIARDHLPFGAGLGRFGSHLSRDRYSPVYEQYGLDAVRLLGPDDPQAATDAYWPMILGETGVIGLAAALAFFAGIAVALWRRASTTSIAVERTIVLAALFVFIEALVRSLTSSVFVAPPIAYFVFGSAGVALALPRAAEGIAVGREVSARGELDDTRVDDAVGGMDPVEHGGRQGVVD